MTNLGYKVHFIDADNKISNMMNIKSLVESGMVTFESLQAKLANTSLKQKIMTPQVALAKQPKGYLEFCDIISRFEKLLADKGEPPADVLVIDSFTRILEHLERLISHLQKKDKFTFDEWGILLSNLEEVFSTLSSLQDLFKHVIIIAHEQTEIDEDTHRITAILPAIKGSMRNKVAAYFEEVYHTITVVKKDKVTFMVETHPINKCDARTSRALDSTVEADFKILFKEEVQ